LHRAYRSLLQISKVGRHLELLDVLHWTQGCSPSPESGVVDVDISEVAFEVILFLVHDIISFLISILIIVIIGFCLLILGIILLLFVFAVIFIAVLQQFVDLIILFILLVFFIRLPLAPSPSDLFFNSSIIGVTVASMCIRVV
jgi:hypothetical protein